MYMFILKHGKRYRNGNENGHGDGQGHMDTLRHNKCRHGDIKTSRHGDMET
jgi:hypothetical protein